MKNLDRITVRQAKMADLGKVNAVASNMWIALGNVLERLRVLAASAASRGVRAREAAECIRAARSYHWVGLYDVTASQISAIAWTGLVPPTHPTFSRSQGLNGAAVSSGAAVIVQDVRKDARYLTTFSATLAEAIFPIRSTIGTVVGTIDVESDRADSFTPDDERFLAACAEALAELWRR